MLTVPMVQLRVTITVAKRIVVGVILSSLYWAPIGRDRHSIQRCRSPRSQISQGWEIWLPQRAAPCGVATLPQTGTSDRPPNSSYC